MQTNCPICGSELKTIPAGVVLDRNNISVEIQKQIWEELELELGRVIKLK